MLRANELLEPVGGIEIVRTRIIAMARGIPNHKEMKKRVYG